MPYKFKGKKDCTQSDGSKGKFMTIKKDGSKRCYKSEKQYKAAQAYAHESDSAYGEEINEDIMRVLIGDFTNEAKINKNKHYADSTAPTGRPRTRNYMKWLAAGMPTEKDAIDQKLPYANDVKNFIKFRNNWSAFEVKDSKKKGLPTLFSFQKTGDLSKDQIEVAVGTPIQLLEPLSNATVNANKTALKGRAFGNFARVKLKNGIEGYLAISDINHKLAGTTSGKIKDAIIGQGVESAVHTAIMGLDVEEAVTKAISDNRNTSEFKNATKDEQDRFKSIMKSAHLAVQNYLSSPNIPNFSDADDPSDAGTDPTGAVDVPAKVDGRTAEIHVKYNDKTRMFGLRRSDGSEASPEFTKARNQVLRKYVPTLASYEAWALNYKSKPNHDPHFIADLNNKKIKSTLGRLGSISIGLDWSPITEQTPVGASNVFIDPRSLITNMHKDGVFQSGLSSLIQVYPDLLTRSEFANVADKLKRDVEKAIKPNENTAPGGVYYFNFTGRGSTATLEVMAFAVPLEVEVLVHNTVVIGDGEEATNQSSKSKGYDIQITVGETVLVPFQIQISSLARGKPLQVLKTDDLKTLLNLIDPDENSEIEDRVEQAINAGKISNSQLASIVEELTLISDNQLSLIIEELTGADKSEIKKMIAKEIDGSSNKKMTQKIFQAEFNKELKKALGTSFIGEPGKINNFVKNSIQKEIEKMFKDKATQNQIGDITKAVIKKLYRELSYSSVHIVDKIKL